MSGGVYEFDAESGTLRYTPANEKVTASVKNGVAYIPVATTTAATDGSETTSNVKVDVTVTLPGANTIVTEGEATIKRKEIYGDEEEEKKISSAIVTENGDVNGVITNADELVKAYKNGGNYRLDKSVTVTETLKVEQNETLKMNLNKNTLEIIASRGINNYGNLGIGNGYITYGDGSDELKAVVGIYNKGEFHLDKIKLTSEGYCVYNTGTEWENKKFEEITEKPKAIFVTHDSEYCSTFSGDNHITEGKHVYAIYNIWNSLVEMTNSEVTGHGGIGVDVSKGYLYNVKATANCGNYSAHENLESVHA